MIYKSNDQYRLVSTSISGKRRLKFIKTLDQCTVYRHPDNLGYINLRLLINVNRFEIQHIYSEHTDGIQIDCEKEIPRKCIFESQYM